MGKKKKNHTSQNTPLEESEDGVQLEDVPLWPDSKTGAVVNVKHTRVQKAPPQDELPEAAGAHAQQQATGSGENLKVNVTAGCQNASLDLGQWSTVRAGRRRASGGSTEPEAPSPVQQTPLSPGGAAEDRAAQEGALLPTQPPHPTAPLELPSSPLPRTLDRHSLASLPQKPPGARVRVPEQKLLPPMLGGGDHVTRSLRVPQGTGSLA